MKLMNYLKLKYVHYKLKSDDPDYIWAYELVSQDSIIKYTVDHSLKKKWLVYLYAYVYFINNSINEESRLSYLNIIYQSDEYINSEHRLTDFFIESNLSRNEKRVMRMYLKLVCEFKINLKYSLQLVKKNTIDIIDITNITNIINMTILVNVDEIIDYCMHIGGATYVIACLIFGINDKKVLHYAYMLGTGTHMIALVANTNTSLVNIATKYYKYGMCGLSKSILKTYPLIICSYLYKRKYKH